MAGNNENSANAKKITLHSEALYAAGLLILSLAVSVLSAADLGVSMIVAPAYILSLKFDFLTFGQSEYILQAVLFVLFCLLMKRIKPVYLTSFVTCLIYGAVLDMWRAVIPWLNPSVTEPGSFSIAVRIAMFAVGMILTAMSVAMFFKTYLYPQVYDFFVKGVSIRYNIDTTKFKRIFDACCLAVALIMTLALFGRLRGVGVGTLIMTAFNGLLIGMFSKMFDKYFRIVPIFPKVEKIFAI